MSNSSLISYKKISPNKTSPRNHKIDTVTIHCYVGKVKAEDAAAWFAQTAAQCSCNYFIDLDGRVALIVDEADRSWCSSNRDNDNRAITIECASDKTHPYAVNDKVMATLLNLLTDICRRNEIKKLLWEADKSLIGQVDKQNMTVHRWFANKACPGDYLYNRHGEIANEVNKRLGSANTATTTAGTQTASFAGLSEKDAADRLLEIGRSIAEKYSLLPSVTAAQTILEAGYCKTELAQKANNVCGMKCKLSGNTWPGSTWDGKSKVTIRTAEQDKAGNVHYENADFRKYPDIETSIADRCAYLLGAMDGSKLRYAGIQDCKDYTSQIKLIKAGGYATDVKYVDKICDIIKRFELDKYDGYAGDILPETEKPWYRVRKSWSNAKSQLEAYHDLKLAKECADKNPGYNVYDESGKAVYTPARKEEYKVQVGSFESKNNALKRVVELKKKGFAAFSYLGDDGQYKVQAGAYTEKANAEAQVKKLKADGFEAIIK